MSLPVSARAGERERWVSRHAKVTVTRLNYVLKSKCLVPYFLFASQAGLVPPEWRWIAYFIIFYSSHNVRARGDTHRWALSCVMGFEARHVR